MLGSHDSGGTPELDPKLPVADDLPDFIRRMGASPFVKAGVKRWGVTQNYSIRKQLEHGVRYLDLRVAYPPPKVRASERDFRLVHGLFGMTLRHCLTQVADFLKENKKEVVLLDVNHVYDVDETRFTTLAKEIGDCFFSVQRKNFDLYFILWECYNFALAGLYNTITLAEYF
ncbi:hypothetical protein COOONC_07422 [Cooperia oncophora]